MKKGLIFTIICNAIIVFSTIIGFISLFWFHLPKEIEKDELIRYMKTKGCDMADIAEFNEINLATENCPININYIVTKNTDKRNQILLNQKNDVANNYNVIGNFNIDIFSVYSELTTSGEKYKKVTQNKNSILYASADKEYKKEIIDLFKHFGYRYQLNFKACWWFLVPILMIILIYIVSIWGIEKKIRNKGWIALIPFYNVGCLTKDVLGSPWYAPLLFIPIGNLVFSLFLHYYLGKSFQKDETDCILLMFFSTIFCPLLAFDDSKYSKA